MKRTSVLAGTTTTPALPSSPSKEVRQRNELLFQSPQFAPLNEIEKHNNALQAIKDYRWQQSHSIEGGCIAMVHWKHILQALHLAQKKGLYEDQSALNTAILEILQYLDYDTEAWQLGFLRLHEPSANTFLIIDTVIRDANE